MKVQVVLYGGLQRFTGCRKIELEVAEQNSSVASVSKQLLNSYPDLEEQLSAVSYSLGDQIVPASTAVSDGDEVGLLPPVSGG
jgi:molybdopterin converting factor small subunit